MHNIRHVVTRSFTITSHFNNLKLFAGQEWN